jgi:hypothetical protein
MSGQPVHWPSFEMCISKIQVMCLVAEVPYSAKQLTMLRFHSYISVL